MMKKIIPFTKEIEFKTMVSKITSISLEHTLRIKENNLISGHFILEGTYKMTQASQIDEEFSYKIPVDIENYIKDNKNADTILKHKPCKPIDSNIEYTNPINQNHLPIKQYL